MDNSKLDLVRTELASAATVLASTDDATVFLRRLAGFIAALEAHAYTILSTAAPAARGGLEERLYDRAVEDYGRLQLQLSQIREHLFDKDLFVETLEQKGNDVASLQRSLSFVHAMDRAVGELIHLMQYDAPDRVEVNVENGFRFSSGSTNYERIYFGTQGGKGDEELLGDD